MRTVLCFLLASAIVFLRSGYTAEPNSLDSPATHIVDRAEFFSEEGERTATKAIDDLKRKHKIDVHVETFASVSEAALPAGGVDAIKQMTAKERGEFFANWLKELASEENAKGIFILACREPSHLRVGVSKELARLGFGETRARCPIATNARCVQEQRIRPRIDRRARIDSSHR